MDCDTDLVILGAGAAGMMCAATAGRRGRRVVLVDHARKLAEKIRISGGGRCNFTHLQCAPSAYLSRDPDFCRAALAAYGPQDFVRLLRRHRIGFHEKSPGQLFCDRSAEDIIALLRGECDRAGVRWAMPAEVLAVTHAPAAAHTRFTVATSVGTFATRSLVVATGGLSIPQLGASPLGYRIAEQFGLDIVPPKPALVPLAAEPEWRQHYGALAGVSFDCRVRCGDGPTFHDSALITHRGLSGPAILQISSYWQKAGGRGAIDIDLLPGEDAARWVARHAASRSQPANLLGRHLTRRLALALAQTHGWTQPLAAMDAARRDELAQTLARWRFRPSGTLGYAKAEVTLGGVDTAALRPDTLECRSVPGLHFIGEVVDVTGWLGGYNFQWAWSSGVAAGRAA